MQFKGENTPPRCDGDIIYQGGVFSPLNCIFFFCWCDCPAEPYVGVGEAVLIYKTCPDSWVRNFVLNDPSDPAIQLNLALNPVAQLTISGPTGAVYRVEATGDLTTTNAWPVLTN